MDDDMAAAKGGESAGDAAAVGEVCGFLDHLGIPWAKAEHAPADTMEACAAIERGLGAPICKNLFLTNRQQSDFYLLMTPGDKPFKTKFLSAQIGAARLSFAGPERMWEFLRLRPGAVSVLGLMHDRGRRVRLLLDRDVAALEAVGCHPCVNTATLKLRVADLLEKFLPAVGHEPTLVDLPWPED